MIDLMIANPSYSSCGPMSLGAQLQAYAKHPDWTIRHFEVASSLLTWGFNTCWAEALNRRKEGLTHFLLLHGDVRPIDEDWLGILMEEMQRVGAQVLSAIIPIKDKRGLTSTALDTDEWRPLRITQRQVQNRLPETWTAPELLFNTGLMLVDFRDPWVEKVCFTMRDKVVKDADGQWRAYVQPEDWHFSRQCRSLGIRVYVTRTVRTLHFGTGAWGSDEIWGEENDGVNGELMIEKARAGTLRMPHRLTETLDA